MLLKELSKKNSIHPPKWLPDNTHYLAIVGSESYGANIAGSSDTDIQGFCMPQKEDIFPHLKGEIPGFGRQIQRFEVWQEHHIVDLSKKKEYDFAVYSIVKFFDLAMGNNPNILDILNVPVNCIIHATPLGQKVRDNRQIFYHTGCFHKFRGYAFQQMAKIDKGSNRGNEKRQNLINKFGYDTKFMMHVFRLALECEQLLLTGELNLIRDSQILISVRNGDWSLEDAKKWWVSKEIELEKAYTNCKILPHKPDEEKIKEFLISCLEDHYGRLSNDLNIKLPTSDILNDLKKLIDRYSN